MNSGLKLVLVTLPLAAIGAGVLAYLVANSPPPERKALAERATPVRVIVAQNQQVSPTVTAFGLVSPARTYEANAQVGGTVEYVNPALVKGEILPEGSVLVRLSPVDFNLAIAQADANIRATEAKLAELSVSEDNQIAALAIETETLALKTADLERVERLFGAGTVSQSTLNGAQSAHLAQRQKVLAIESTIALMPTQRAVQLEQIAVYKASQETATQNLARTELKLPFSARVASVSVEVGQYLSVGKTSAVLDGIDVAEVEAQVPVAAMRSLLQFARPAAGDIAVDPSTMTKILRSLDITAEVSLSLGQEDARWSATLNRISDTIDQKTGTLGVIVQVSPAFSVAEPGERPPLTKGMFVQVTLSAKPVTGLVVPRSALRDGQLALAGADNRLSFIPVTPYLVQDAIVVIAEGLEEGARVVVSDPSPAMPGMLLDLTEDTGLMARLAAEGPTK